MRKPKNDTFSNRFSTRVENHLDQFYMSYLTDDKIKEFSARLKDSKRTKKEVLGMVKILKTAIDKFYILNKVEQKYIYFSNLYELYDMLCKYFFENSKFEDFVDICDGIMTTKSKDGTELFGYQTAFNKEINKRFQDISSRMHSTIIETSKRYVSTVRPESKRRLEKEITKICDAELFVTTKEKKIKKEVAFINAILNRVKYARDHVDLAFLDCKESIKGDKRIRKNIKGILTRIENTFEIITKEL